jgi:hypothetical protein
LLAGPVGTHWLFWETFCGLDDEIFLNIAEAGTFMVLASIVLDHIVDGQVGHAIATVLLHNALREHGVARFQMALPPTSAFWAHYDRLTAKHLAGLAAELAGRSDPRQFTLERLHQIAHGKVSSSVTTIAALAVAGGRPAILEPIEISLKHLASAFQLLDDVEDWKHDFETGNLTYFLAQLAPPEAWLLPDWPSAGELWACIAADWKDVEHIRKTKEWLDEAIEAVHDLDCPKWKHYVSSFQTLADQHMTRSVAYHLSRAIRPLVGPVEE